MHVDRAGHCARGRDRSRSVHLSRCPALAPTL